MGDQSLQGTTKTCEVLSLKGQGHPLYRNLQTCWSIKGVKVLKKKEEVNSKKELEMALKNNGICF